MTQNVCVIIPAYECADTISEVIRGAQQHLTTVIVADDGSHDHTAQMARKTGAHVIRFHRNRGKGHVLKVLFAKAAAMGFEAVISMDADGQHDADDIPRFLTAHRHNPEAIIVGSRMHDQGKIPRSRFNSMRVARYYVTLAANQFIDDTQCGFRLYPLAAVQGISLTTERYVTETEVLMKAGDMGLPIESVPVTTVYDQQESHFRPVNDVSAITTYVIFYLTVKWILEAFRPNCSNTYGPGDIRDRIGKHPGLAIGAQVTAVIIVLLTPLVLWMVYQFLTTDRFTSLRQKKVRISRIIFITHALPILLILPFIQHVLALIGRRSELVEGYITAVMTVADDT